MAELKTKKTKVNVRTFLRAVPDERKRADSLSLLTLFEKATGEKAKMWGEAIVGFGQYHYESKRSSQKGDWPLTGFSPRKGNITLYIMPGFKEYKDLMRQLGSYKISGGSCLYIKKLEDIDAQVLTKLIKRSVGDMKKQHRGS